MKIFLVCNECFKRDIGKSDEEQRMFASYYQLNDEGVYQIDCPACNSYLVRTQAEKFEILFELGLFAIADGYYREAVSSFTSSLERFYEFYLNVISIKYEVPFEVFSATWKEIANQSERQLGAFLIAHSFENKLKPDLLSSKKTAFRNSVIHKGKIPNKNEAIDYGKIVLDIIKPIYRELNEKNNEFMWKFIIREINKLNEKYPGLSHTNNTPTLLSIVGLTSEPSYSFEKRMSDIEKIAAKARLYPDGMWYIGVNASSRVEPVIIKN